MAAKEFFMRKVCFLIIALALIGASFMSCDNNSTSGELSLIGKWNMGYWELHFKDSSSVVVTAVVPEGTFSGSGTYTVSKWPENDNGGTITFNIVAPAWSDGPMVWTSTFYLSKDGYNEWLVSGMRPYGGGDNASFKRK